MKHKQFTKKMVATLNKMPLPEGFKGIFTTDFLTAEPVFVVENKAADIRLTFRVWGGGTTAYKHTDGNWRNFDRRGVEDSFYWIPPFDPNEKIDLQALIARQLERIEERRKFHLTAIQVPDIGYTIQPETYKRYKAQLKERGSVSFMPSGFGTGYTFVRRTNRSFGVKKASVAAEKFWGVKPLWIEENDCD